MDTKQALKEVIKMAESHISSLKTNDNYVNSNMINSVEEAKRFVKYYDEIMKGAGYEVE